jgi:serine protease Do
MDARWLALSLVAFSGVVSFTPEALGQPAPKAPSTKAAAAVPIAKLPPAPAAPSPKVAPPVAARSAAPGAASADVRKLGDAFVDVAEKVSPSVVQIDVVTGGDGGARWLHAEPVQRGLGSGVIFSADGAVLTNNHVIEDARSINVRLRDGRMFAGRLVGRDPATDLAVLRIEAKDLPAAHFADSDGAHVGEWVLAIGSPFGLGQTVTTGVLSAKGRGGMGINAVEDYLQTDASINPGNSGGPLVDLDGQVLGINTMIVSRGQGIGLAVPSRMARRVAEQLIKTGRVDRAWIGIGMQDLTPQLAAEIPSAPQAGALVNTVTPNGPAAKAHVEPGDIVASFGGKPVHEAQDILREVFAHPVGDAVPLEVVRSGKHYQTKVVLESRNEPAPPPLPIERQVAAKPGLGLTLREVQDPTEGEAGTVVQVTAVASDSAADAGGIKAGDLILDVDRIKQPSAAQVMKAAEGGHVLLRVRRQGAVFYTALRR